MRISQDQFESLPSQFRELFDALPNEGKAEVLAGFPDANGATSNGRKGVAGIYQDGVGSSSQTPGYADSGSAARFFYHAKANKNDRAGSSHPTVKPIALISWLIRLVTPPGGTILDPFAGTGTTAAAAFQEGARCVLIEREEEYRKDIVRRVEALKIEEPKPIKVKRAPKLKAPVIATDLFSAGHA